MPGRVAAPTVYATLACVAVQPIRFEGVTEAVQPSGTEAIDRRTRSKKVALRATVIGMTPPSGASTFGGVGLAAWMANVPRAQIREVSSRGSCIESGSVDVFQLKLPR